MYGILLLKSIIVIIFVVVAHEAIHFLTAKLLTVSATIDIHNFFVPKVTYTSNTTDWKIVLITISPTIVLILCGYIIPPKSYMLSLLKIMCYLNVTNLIPLTGDGEVLLLALLNMILRKKS